MFSHCDLEITIVDNVFASTCVQESPYSFIQVGSEDQQSYISPSGIFAASKANSESTQEGGAQQSQLMVGSHGSMCKLLLSTCMANF